ncbi:MAG: GNAT family N-acetyltransferase [Desulfatibacillaceae bacterium]|nr:GNAT family N-acetyltransferase [Desulfatibacillaceae bacterium]
MIRIRRIYDDVLPVNKQTLGQIQKIIKTRFPAADENEIAQIGPKLRNPFKQRFRSLLLVAETLQGRVLGFALLLHEPEIGFVFLDWIATLSGKAGGGIGGALYDRVRSEAAALNAKGLFFECLPDDRIACPDEALLKENRARLRFYERYGARPVVNTKYEAPVKPGDTCMPHLVYDALKEKNPLRKSFARKVVRAILERKYAGICPPEYVEMVVESFADDPVRLRDLRYVRPEATRPAVEVNSREQIALVINEHHQIHHVHERGYVESPVRVSAIKKELDSSGLFAVTPVRSFPDKAINAVHDPVFTRYLRKACESMPEGKSLYPYIFPIRNKARLPKEQSVLAGYYCIDTFTPISKNAWPAARSGADAALTAAHAVLKGNRVAYALVRPPGHHAEKRAFGGFCYLNNNAIVAQALSAYGKVAILDIDYHHGNGQQEIFYNRADVLTVSIHGHPSFAYPYFSGFAQEEQGEGDGEGFNFNLPLPEKVDGKTYREALDKALARIEIFAPQFLVVALGLDTAKGDPSGTWLLTAKDFEENGRRIGALGLPVVVVQEGGYNIRTLGANALAFFRGLSEATARVAGTKRDKGERIHGVGFRYEVSPEDSGKVHRLVRITGFFSDEEVDVAKELVDERLAKGDSSGYHFVMAEHYGRLVGYSCYGRIPGTASSHDLYWIAIHPEFQGRGLGRRLLLETEKKIKQAGGTRVYADTSQRAQYASTRAFYESCGYRLETVLEDFYDRGDGKAIYSKPLL